VNYSFFLSNSSIITIIIGLTSALVYVCGWIIASKTNWHTTPTQYEIIKEGIFFTNFNVLLPVASVGAFLYSINQLGNQLGHSTSSSTETIIVFCAFIIFSSCTYYFVHQHIRKQKSMNRFIALEEILKEFHGLKQMFMLIFFYLGLFTSLYYIENFGIIIAVISSFIMTLLILAEFESIHKVTYVEVKLSKNTIIGVPRASHSNGSFINILTADGEVYINIQEIKTMTEIDTAELRKIISSHKK
jgi:hypothetical protein